MKEINTFAEGGEGDVGRLVREINEWTGTLTRTLNDLAHEQLDGTDERGVVRARISGAGRLLGLTIDSRGLRDLDHVQLAEAVKEAIGAAHGTMGDRLTELTAGLVDPRWTTPDGSDPLASHIQRVLREG